MNIADLVHKRPEQRRVGVVFPDRIRLVSCAKRIYVELGIAVDLDEDRISIEVPRIAAPLYMGALERATGIRGYSEWDCNTRTDS